MLSLHFVYYFFKLSCGVYIHSCGLCKLLYCGFFESFFGLILGDEFCGFFIAYAFDLGYFKSVGILFMFLCLLGYGYSMDFVLNGGNKIERRSALCKAYFSAPCGNGSCAVLGVFHKSEQWAGHTHSL